MREKVQQQAEELLIANKDVGIVALGMGLGKSYIAINRIKQGNYKNILITGYRTPLKENWEKELIKWGFKRQIFSSKSPYLWKYGENEYVIHPVNIQTAYKATKEELNYYDLIILDEIHELATEEYGKLIINASELGIARIGLSGTPDLKNKKEFYDKYCPVLMEYYDVEGPITNEVNMIVYKYELSDNYKVTAGTKTKQWQVGEKKQYDYIESVFTESKKIIEKQYFEELKQRCLDRLHPEKPEDSPYNLTEEDIIFLEDCISKDLEHFYSITKPRFEAKDLSRDLYWFLRNVKDWNYSILGTKAYDYLKSPEFPANLKPTLMKYCWALKERKEFLWNLTSSTDIALKLKDKILHTKIYINNIPACNLNKVLLFSELTSQSAKLSQYQFHSKTGRTVKISNELNKKILKRFNSGEIREISSVNSLTSGVNLVGCNYVIVESFNSSDVKSQQIRGRLRRLGLSDEATLIVIVPKNTQAETWFKNSYGDMEYTVINDINDLKI